MKHIDLFFENFESYKRLSFKQEEDLREIFWEFVTLNDFQKKRSKNNLIQNLKQSQTFLLG